MTHDYSIYRQYVCYHCFRQMTECTCKHLPQNLLFIDEGIQEHVRLLNIKGYYTMACCEGHYREDHPDVAIYIALARDNADLFPPLPEGFVFDKKQGITSIRYFYQCVRQKPTTKEDFEKEKSTALKSLLEWAEALNDHPYMVHDE